MQQKPLVTDLTLSSGMSRSLLPMNLPTAASSLPTLGSLPAMAHLNKGELTTARPMSRAMRKDGAFLTVTWMTWLVPSPLRTMSSASFLHTCAARTGQRGLATSGLAHLCWIVKVVGFVCFI